MVKTWFNSAGWPKDVAPTEHSGFAYAILRHKDDALQAMLRGGEVPLRQGACRLHGAGFCSSRRTRILMREFGNESDASDPWTAVNDSLGPVGIHAPDADSI